MTAATTERTNAHLALHLSGPFRSYDTVSHEVEVVDTFAEAHDMACADSSYIEVLAADGTVVGWSGYDGKWHGAVS